MANEQLFRKAALDRLSNPEQLDRALTVTTAKGWLAVCAAVAIAAAVVAWSVTGEVSTYVQAPGILLDRDGEVVDVVSSGRGTLTRILAPAGASVEKDDIIALAANEEVTERHRSALALVAERAESLDQYRATATEEDAIIAEHLDRQRARLDRLEASGRQSVENARARLENHRRLFEERVVTRITLDRSQQAFDRAEQELFATLRERDSLEFREVQRQNERSAAIAEREARLQEAERRVAEITAQLDTQRIATPVAGLVTEVKAQVGSVLNPGQAVLSVKTGGESLEALIYVPATDGKTVEAGMEALVSPVTVRREEYGSILGSVSGVSAFPVTQEGMVAVLQNRDLVRSLSEGGAPYAARVALESDPLTTSGYAWTSPKASTETITSGTLATVEIKVDSDPPIALVVPLIKEAFGL